jgi:hypothetical protein
MKHALLAAGIAALLFPRSVAAQSLDAGDLRRAGLLRIGDLVSLAEGWSVDTIEGFTLIALPPGFPLKERPAYLVVIDDVFMDLDQLGVTSLNRLPLSLDDVESVRFESQPVLVRGRFAPGGIIRITTRRPEHSVEVHGRHATGSETGDPGPYQFTEFNSRNVERIGFDSSISAGSGGETFWGDGAFRLARHYASDDAIIDRYVAIGGPDFRVLEKTAPSARFGWAPSVSNSHATSFGRASWIDEGFFLAPLGQETPVENTFQQAGVEGMFVRRDRFSAGGTLAATVNELDASARGATSALDWRTRSIEGTALASMRFGEIGARVEIHDVEAQHSIANDSWTSGGVFGSWKSAHPSSTDMSWSTEVQAGVERSREENGASLTASYSRWNDETTSKLSLSAAQMLPEDSAPFWYWREQGFAVLEDEGVPVVVDGEIQAAKVAGLDGSIELRSSEGRRKSFQAGFLARALGDLALEDGDSLRTNEDGVVAGVSLSVDAPFRSTSRFHAWARAQDAVGGSSLFREASRAAPQFAGRAVMSTTPFPSFDVDVTLRGQSSTTVAAWASLDLNIQKYFAARRLRGGLAFQNLLNNPYRTHPIGQITGLTIAVQLEWIPGGGI